nr:hypothetical protein CFP56_64181 [Quercus suber]
MTMPRTLDDDDPSGPEANEFCFLQYRDEIEQGEWNSVGSGTPGTRRLDDTKLRIGSSSDGRSSAIKIACDICPAAAVRMSTLSPSHKHRNWLWLSSSKLARIAQLSRVWLVRTSQSVAVQLL